MNLPSSLLETAQDLFQVLLRVNPEWRVKTRYGILLEVINVAINQKLRDVSVKLSGTYAKMDFLLKQYHVRETDRSLSFALNHLRHRLMELNVTEEEKLEQTWGYDLKAVVRFIETIYDAVAPKAMNLLLPTGDFREAKEEAWRKKEDVPDCVRCTIVRWDNTYIYATREDNDEDVRINYAAENAYVPGDWTYLRQCMVEGEAMNVIRPREQGGAWVAELLIYTPDYLINVSTIASCFTPVGHTAFSQMVKRIEPNLSTRHTLLGNFASQMLDEVAYRTDTPYSESIRHFFRHNALGLVACEKEIGRDFHEEARRQKQHIEHMLHQTMPKEMNHELKEEEIVLEPSFFSDALGLQGRMDFLELNYRMVIEQKSGKCRYMPGVPQDKYAGMQEAHYVQALLYRALLHYDYAHLHYEQMQAFLLYSRYKDGLQETPSAPRLLFEAIKLRNQLAWCEEWYARGGMRALETLTPEKLYPGAQGPLWQRFTRPQIEQTLRPIREASALEKAYYFRFLQFLSNEQVLSKIGTRTKENSGFASVWNTPLDDKREAGNIYEGMTLEPEVKEGKVAEARLIFAEHGAMGNTDMSNFRVGDIVFFYPYVSSELPDATATMVFRCTITDIQPEYVRVRLRNAQTSPLVFQHFKHCVWAMEHDFMESSYSSLYRGMHAFLSAPKERRNLLLGQRRPRFNTNITLQGDYGNEEFNSLVLHARQADDLYLVIGPPGTGKTSFGLTNILHEELLQEGTSVLLLSYTNRAVDEICSKLVELDGGIDFVRLGSDFSCEERYRKYLLSERVSKYDTLQQVKHLIRHTRVFCGTTTALNSSISLLEMRQFSLAIIDEASQILEPHIVGLLSACYQGKAAIKRFVLIGDEKQLPAVVLQAEDESRVADPMLQQIGLTDCRLSLFERLLHLYGYDGNHHTDERVCHMLTHQGRMHQEIADFPNHAFYEGRLNAVPLPHQTEPTPQKGESDNWIDNLIETRRVAFLSCLPNNHPDEPDKVNTVEAELIADIVEHTYRKLDNDFDVATSVGVIVPYRNQIATVRAAIDRRGIKKLHDITIDTVERYQGSQRDTIVYSFTAKKKYQLSFLTNNEYIDERTGSIIDRKLNVAMTRARKRLMLIGNAPLLTADETFYRLIEYCKEHGAYYDV